MQVTKEKPTSQKCQESAKEYGHLTSRTATTWRRIDPQPARGAAVGDANDGDGVEAAGTMSSLLRIGKGGPAAHPHQPRLGT